MTVSERPTLAHAAQTPSPLVTAERDFAAGLMFRHFAEAGPNDQRAHRFTPDIIAAALKREPSYLARLRMTPGEKLLIAEYSEAAVRPTKIRTIIRGASATEEFAGINPTYHQTDGPQERMNMAAAVVIMFMGRVAVAQLGEDLIKESAPKLKAAGKLEEAFLDSYQAGVLRDSPAIRALVLKHGQPDFRMQLKAGQQSTLGLATIRGDEDVLQYARDKTAKAAPSALIPH